jgi:UDP-N-acetylmuramate dehydrogenase
MDNAAFRLVNFVEAIKKNASEFTGQLDFDYALSKVSYYQIGGPATVLATPRSWEDLEFLHRHLIQHPVPFFILGWGSNVLFSDLGFSGLVIRMKHLFTNAEVLTGLEAELHNQQSVLKLGASLGGPVLLRQAAKLGWGKLSALTGIPGSVGGMIAMNAGTHIGEVKDLCVKVEYVKLGQSADANLKIHTHTVNESSFSYRRNHFLEEGDLVTGALFKHVPEDPEIIATEIDELYRRRKATQPVDLPSCGSVFKNPKSIGLHAWQVIEKLGLRGYQIGQAQFSPKHGNFIVNLGGARSTDVKALIELAKSRAASELGIQLELEVRIL